MRAFVVPSPEEPVKHELHTRLPSYLFMYNVLLIFPGVLNLNHRVKYIFKASIIPFSLEMFSLIFRFSTCSGVVWFWLKVYHEIILNMSVKKTGISSLDY